ALLGETLGGILVTDRWSASNWYPVRGRQRCWAPLWRDSEAMGERGGRSKAVGEALQRHARQRLHWWHRVRDGTLQRASLRSAMRPLRREVARRLEAGRTCGTPNTAGVCREILTRHQAVWTCGPLE